MHQRFGEKKGNGCAVAWTEALLSEGTERSSEASDSLRGSISAPFNQDSQCRPSMIKKKSE